MEKIDLIKYLPKNIVSGKNKYEYELKVKVDDESLTCYYFRPSEHAGFREYCYIIPRFISKTNETFEVLGLLQAEMGKTQNGCINFCNHEHQLINKVINWFDKELYFPKDRWKWYIKININEPLDQSYKKEVEGKVVNHWIKKIGLSLEQAYPKKVSYIKNTENKELGFYDYGTLIIERKNNILSQIIKNFVKKTTQNILSYEEDEIRNFMRGIIAGESNVEIHKQSKHYRVYISSNKFEERKIFQDCLNRLGISSTNYDNFVGLIVSKKENNLKLFKQRLMCLSPKKYNKFLRMLSLYGDFDELKDYKSKMPHPHNKIPQKIIKKIIELHHKDPSAPAWQIAEQVGVSAIKVQRVRKENNLDIRRLKTPKHIIERINYHSQ